ncbi:hypothetical protein SDC9_174173 [bioreactor metagenome]|uniref:Uncharacterized protein n=1 Tax=bioreactor metagenome TaxID=1076179 RepID=A0A645GIJ4_9ZZZZ
MVRLFPELGGDDAEDRIRDQRADHVEEFRIVPVLRAIANCIAEREERGDLRSDGKDPEDDRADAQTLDGAFSTGGRGFDFLLNGFLHLFCLHNRFFLRRLFGRGGFHGGFCGGCCAGFLRFRGFLRGGGLLCGFRFCRVGHSRFLFHMVPPRIKLVFLSYSITTLKIVCKNPTRIPPTHNLQSS